MSLIGGAALARDLARMAQAVTGGKTAALQPGGEVILDLAKAKMPVLTGESRDALAMEVQGDEVIVGSRLSGPKPWAIEYGTSDTAAQPAVRSAVDVGADRAFGAIGEGVGRIVDGEW